MALSREFIHQIDQKQILGNSVSGSPCSLNCSVLGDTYTSEVLEHPGHTALPDVKCKEKLKCSGSFHLVYGGFNDPSRSFYPELSMSNEVGLVSDSPSTEKPDKKISKKKNKKKGKPTKKSLDEVVSETKPNKCGQDNAMACYQSSKEEIDCPVFNCEKCSKNNSPSAVISSLHASECEFSKDSCVQNDMKLSECSCGGISNLTGSHLASDVRNCNCETSTCCKGINISKQGPKEIITNCCTEDFQDSLSFGHSYQWKSCETINITSCEVEDCNGCGIENTKIGSQCSCVSNVHAITPSNEFKFNTLTSQSDAINITSRHPYIQNGKENNRLIWKKSQKNVREAQTRGARKSNPNHVKMDVSLPEENFVVKHNPFLSEGLLPTHLVSSSGHNNAAHGNKEMVFEEQVMCRRIHGNVLVESSQWAVQQRLNGSLYQYVSQSSQVGTRETEYRENSKAKLNHLFKLENNSNRKKGVESYKSNFFRLQNKSVFSQNNSSQDPFELHHYTNSDAAQGTIYNSQHVVTYGSYCLHSSPASSAHVQQNVPCSALSVPGRVLHGTKPYTLMKIPRMEHVVGRPLHASVDREQGNPAGSELKRSYENKTRQNVTSQTSLKKWIPVGRKEPRMLESTGSVGTCNDYNDKQTFTHKRENDSYPEGNIVSLCGPASLSDPGSTSFISRHKMTSVKSKPSEFESICTEIKGQKVEIAKDYVSYGNKPKDAPQFLIDSEMAVQALNAAYRLQLASESVQLATGCPLAEFERLLHSTAPVIAPSFVYEKCAVCLDNKPFLSSLCKHQIPNISLRAVWNWYEKPGNYGLEVKAEDSQNLKGLLAGSISFHAHFVPFLSAIQLFGYPHLCYGRSKSTEHINPEILEKGEFEPHSSSKTSVITFPEAIDVNHFQAEEIKLPVDFDSVDVPVSSLEVSPCNGTESLSLVSFPGFSSDSQLIFEFFESEQPQQRKPLHIKIMELINAGTSNHQVFGDPSKLECMNLYDLHPASWFSVAWYPIYRIPEGNFRASFLTYHSLGHLVQRGISVDSVNCNTFCMISPVLGLQSYNTQGECWFDSKIPVESSFKEFTPFNSSEIILKERLRTLEENALLFARGCVRKDQIKVVNRQPDYEFFISRKR